jgi:DNA-binding transcriptional regulator YiaG
METITDSPELVVWAEKGALAEAKDTFSQFDASFRTIPSASSKKDISTSKVSLFYLRDAEPNAEFESILKAFKGHKTSFVVFYTPHHSSDFAFRMGKIVGKHSLDSADWAFNLRHVEQLLRARNVLAHPLKTAERFDITAARKRLGLTQEQMANALNVTTRTLQNWESGLGTSQMPKKTQDLRELLGLMDDYVIAPKEREWLDTSLPAVQNRRPTDVIASGKLRDLIVEFQRLREGQPV